MGNELAVMRFDEMEKLAGYMAKSNLFGIKTPEQAISLMALSQAEGLHPAIAARDYHIVQGRPTLKADAMLSRFQQAGGKVEWKDYSDTSVVGVFTHPQGGSVEVGWTMEMAKKANLTGKDVWRQYPRQMLRARVISEGIRTIYPGVAVGIYTPEEAQEFTPQEPMKDITPEVQPIFKTAKLRNAWFDKVVQSFESAETSDELLEAVNLQKSKFDELEANGHEADVLAVEELRKRFSQIRTCLSAKVSVDELDDDFRSAIEGDYQEEAQEVVTLYNLQAMIELPQKTQADLKAKHQQAMEIIRANPDTKTDILKSLDSIGFNAALSSAGMGGLRRELAEL